MARREVTKGFNANDVQESIVDTIASFVLSCYLLLKHLGWIRVRTSGTDGSWTMFIYIGAVSSLLSLAWFKQRKKEKESNSKTECELMPYTYEDFKMDLAMGHECSLCFRGKRYSESVIRQLDGT